MVQLEHLIGNATGALELYPAGSMHAVLHQDMIVTGGCWYAHEVTPVLDEDGALVELRTRYRCRHCRHEGKTTTVCIYLDFDTGMGRFWYEHPEQKSRLEVHDHWKGETQNLTGCDYNGMLDGVTASTLVSRGTTGVSQEGDKGFYWMLRLAPSIMEQVRVFGETNISPAIITRSINMSFVNQFYADVASSDGGRHMEEDLAGRPTGLEGLEELVESLHLSVGTPAGSGSGEGASGGSGSEEGASAGSGSGEGASAGSGSEEGASAGSGADEGKVKNADYLWMFGLPVRVSPYRSKVTESEVKHILAVANRKGKHKGETEFAAFHRKCLELAQSDPLHIRYLPRRCVCWSRVS